jgi:hypothetical protein
MLKKYNYVTLLLLEENGSIENNLLFYFLLFGVTQIYFKEVEII